MLGVKQYHLACALTDKYGFECHFAHTWTNGLNWRLGLKKFPNLKKMVSNSLYLRNYQYEEDYEVFETVNHLSKIGLKESGFDWVYCNTLVEKMPDFPNIWLDIEDLSYYTTSDPKKRNLNRLPEDQKAINKAKIVTFGSKGELKTAKRLYNFQHYKPELMYPYVAERTLPKTFKKKDDDFSLVYAGSSYAGSYRDFFPMFEEIAKNADYNFTIYLTSWRNRYSWNKLLELAEKYPNLTAKKSVSFAKLKYEISNFHAGLTIFKNKFRKAQLTFGMKPLEYAYAKVQPVSIGNKLMEKNNTQFGYQSTPETIEKDFIRNLSNFNRFMNLMDNNIGKIVELMKNE
jgi:hypothetical protein